MALLHRWARLVRGWPGLATIALVLGVTAWWRLIVGANALTLQTPEAVGQRPLPAFLSGQSASISAPSGAMWRIPRDRVTFDDSNSAVRNDDGAGITRALDQPGWAVVIHGQIVRVVSADRDVAQVDLLESPNSGSRGRLKAEHLRPYTDGRRPLIASTAAPRQTGAML